jgi:hypothetical protein
MSTTTAPAAHPLTLPLDAAAVTPLAGPGFTFTLVRDVTDLTAVAAEAAHLRAHRQAFTAAAAAL